jgi:hypothetical protein
MSTRKHGLDKATRLAEKRALAARAKVIPPLDPPFPFTMRPFDPGFFALPANPEPMPDPPKG